MNELSTTQTELVEKTNECQIKPTAMELILERALENDVDMDRLERLLQLRDKEIERQNYQSFVSDLSAMQTEYQKIHKNATNPHTNSKYATLDKYIDAIKEPLAKYHFSLSAKIKEQGSNDITVEMTLRHPTGNEISTEGRFPYDSTGKKSDIHAFGSAITYARRYLLGMLLNVASKEDDKDGNKEDDTDENPPIKKACPQHINEIRNLIEQTETNEDDLLAYANIEKLTDLTYEKAQEVLGLLAKKQNIQRERALQSLPQQEQTDASIQDAEYIHIQDIEYAPTQQQRAV
ncbi:ERF family protein [Bartonella gabonensis]|uniref:ERF family protein n=1 Tax=Bartonella gabonensis TaxID=2699889 RepID=UPI00158C21F7|nr:ERF family protein [Bartonella gabonensis]